MITSQLRIWKNKHFLCEDDNKHFHKKRIYLRENVMCIFETRRQKLLAVASISSSKLLHAFSKSLVSLVNAAAL